MAQAQRQETATPQLQLSARARNAVLGAVLLGLFLAALDQTVVGTALPRIVTDLHGNGLYTWVVTAYLLTSTITVPIYGKLSDIYGRRPVLMIGISIFLAGSLLSGLSQDMTQLIFFRGLQGLGAGSLFPISLAVIGDMFTPRERGRYQGLFGGVFGISFIVGPFIGGYLTDNVNWHWVFYVNMPVGIAALVIIAAVLPTFHPDIGIKVRDLDYLGIALFSAGLVPILIGLTNKGLTDSSGNLHAWTDGSVGGLIILGAVMLVGFLFAESRARQPIIPLDLFRDRTFSATNTAVFLVGFGMFAAIIFLPRYFQAVQGISATESGYLIWPLLVGLIGASILSGLFISKVGRYKFILIGGMVMFCLGSYLMTHLQTNTSNPLLWLWMFLIGLGIGPAMSGFTVVVQNSAPPAKLGAATSTLTFLRQVGGSVGLAVSGFFFTQRFTEHLPGALQSAGVPPTIAHHFTSASQGTGGSLTGVSLAAQLNHNLPASLHRFIPNIVSGIHNAFSMAVGDVFWITVVAALVAFAATLIIVEHPLRGPAETSAELADLIPQDASA